jgi:sugar phosphate isomerase/epimerase
MYHRREILFSIAGALAAGPLRIAAAEEIPNPQHVLASAARQSPIRHPTKLGICTDSYALRKRDDRKIREPGARFTEPLRFLEYCHERGAGGIQLDIGRRDETYARKLRQQAQDWGMFVEASMGLPRDEADVERFDAELTTAQNAGVTVIRTVMPGRGSGRRYEAYDSAEAVRAARARGRRALELAEPVVARHRMRLAVENHKDERIPERLETLKALGSEYVGACVDTGNDVSFLEDPMAVVEAYAPWAFSVHLKDMAVQEYEEGFLLAEVPLGEGVLDLPKVVQILRQHHPEVHFLLEMMTRDPLKVPCLTEKYWAAMGDVPGVDLARTLRLVRARGRRDLPRISHLSLDEQYQREDGNVKRCLAWAREHLGL